MTACGQQSGETQGCVAVSTPHAPDAVGPYSRGVRVENSWSTLYVSGQLALDPSSGSLSGTTAAEETKFALSTALAVVAAGGGGTAPTVTKVTIFLRDLDRFDDVNDIYAATMGNACPACSAVEVSGLPRDALVEVEMIAAIPPNTTLNAP